MKNLFNDFSSQLPQELVTVLAESQHIRIERIVSTGHSSPEGFWYDQDEQEWVVVLQGKATLNFQDGDSVEMNPGDHVLIPAHMRHHVESTSPDGPTVWLAVFYRD